jgi:hypothetical protein
MYLQADKPSPIHRLHHPSGGALRGARGGARRPHKKEKKEVIEASGSPLSAFSPSFPLISSTFSFYGEAQNAVAA